MISNQEDQKYKNLESIAVNEKKNNKKLWAQYFLLHLLKLAYLSVGQAKFYW